MPNEIFQNKKLIKIKNYGNVSKSTTNQLKLLSNLISSLNPKQQVLTNYEVLQTLRQLKDKKIANSAINLATITYEVIN